jgi:hypothetical protein
MATQYLGPNLHFCAKLATFVYFLTQNPTEYSLTSSPDRSGMLNDVLNSLSFLQIRL